ncbi:MAG: hypothetical protein ACR2NN_07635 [Bryobacteraceae bacterium]
MSISSSAASMELAIFGVGLATSAAARDLVAIPFTDSNGLKSSSAVFPGIAGPNAGSGKLQAAIANFGSAAHQATITISESGSQKTVATIPLAPNSVSTADLTSALSGQQADASLIVTADGKPGEVLSGIQVLATPGSGSSNVTLPWKDRNQRANGGQHPWRIDGGFSSTVMLFNPDRNTGNNAITFSVYADHKTWTKLVSVPPLTTVALRLNDIVDKQRADDKEPLCHVKARMGSSPGSRLSTRRSLADWSRPMR